MHRARRVLSQFLLAFALVVLALPAAVITGSSPGAHAQGDLGSNTIPGVATVTPGVAFNTIGSSHTVNFTCLAADCYFVNISAQNASLGTSTPITAAQCNNFPSPTITGSTVDCFGGFFFEESDITDTASATIQEGAPYVYAITFTGYILPPSSGTCPSGTTPTTIDTTAVCQFSVTAQKKYVEVTGVTVTPVGTCGGTVIFSESLKSYLGPQCAVTFAVSGTVNIKQTATCTGEPTGPAPAEYGPNATYVCNNGFLSVTNVSAAANAAPTGVTCSSGTAKTSGGVVSCPAGATLDASAAVCPAYASLGSVQTSGTGTSAVESITCVANGNLAAVPLTITSTGIGASSGATFGSGGATYCVATSTPTTSATTGQTINFCPTTYGTASITACVSSGLNTQPQTPCATKTFTFTLASVGRVIPYVRWAGEKIVLTKCFGGGFGGLVEFTLDGNNPGLNATLLPVDTSNASIAGIDTTGTLTPSTADTVYAVTDSSGCASVILYATGEGAASVDAALYAPGVTGGFSSSTTTATTTTTGAATVCDSTAGATVGTNFTLPVTSTSGIVAGERVQLSGTTFPYPFYNSINVVSVDSVGSTITLACPTTKAGGVTIASGSTVTAYTAAAVTTTPIINEHAFDVFYLKFDHIDLENISATGTSLTSAASISPDISFLASAASSSVTGGTGFPTGTVGTTVTFPTLPGQGQAAGGTYAIPLCGTDLLRAMVHGYFEIPGDASNRPASTVTIPGAPTGAANGYTLPAGRWVLPEDWPVLATFEGFTSSTSGNPVSGANNPASVWAWDINSGFAFNPTVEPGVLCTGPANTNMTESGPISDFNAGPCYGGDEFGNATGSAGAGYSTAPDDPNCTSGMTVGIGPFDATQACTNPYPLPYSPPGSGNVVANTSGSACGSATYCNMPLGPNSTYLPNGYLSEWDAPMPPAQVTFNVTGGPGSLDQVNKSGVYNVPATFAVSSSGTCPGGSTLNTAGTACNGAYYYNPFYAEAIPASPLIPPVTNNGGYLWNSWNFNYGKTLTTTGVSTVVPVSTTTSAAGDTTACSTGTTFTLSTGDTTTWNVGDTVQFTISGTTYSTTVAGTSATSLTLNCGSLGAALTIPSATVITDITLTNNNNLISLPVAAGAESAAPAGTLVTIVSPNANCNMTTLVVSTSSGDIVVQGPLPFNCGGIPAGSTIIVSAAGNGGTQTGPGGEIIAAPPNPYPFWQWLTGGGTAGSNTATVYSDNHGEAMVSIDTGFTGQQIPAVNGTCPTVGGVATSPLPSTTGATTMCLVPLSALAGLGFQNVKAAVAGGTGCYNTTNTGSITPATGATAVPTATGTVTTSATATSSGPTTVGPNGPAAGQICINSLGNVEFGTGAALGSTTVSAIADYPYTRGVHPQISSGSITKVFTSAFTKSVSVSAGTPSAATGVTNYTVTITALDVCGNPLSGEPINVYALGPSGGVVLSPTGTSTISGTSSATVMVSPTTGTATLGLEVLNTAVTTSGLVIKVVFPLEGIERFATVIPGTTAPTTTTQVYAPGYQMVGGPSGTNFGVTEAMFSYDNATNTYTNVSASSTNISSAPPACTGYWAYFAAPAAVSINVTSKPGDTAACSLAAGWNLVGNPFGSAAILPSGTTAYYWNGTAYTTVGQIPVGGAVWVYETAAATLTLTAS